MSVESRRNTRVMAVIALGLLGFLVMPRVLGRGDSTAPPELVGTWITDVPSYGDRAFTVGATTLAMYRGDEQIAVHPILSVRQQTTPQGTRYDLEYGDSKAPATFSVLYTSDGETTLQFPHQRGMEWRRKP